MKQDQKEFKSPMIQKFPSAQRFSFFILAIILSLFVLIQGKLFLYPIALGILFAYLLYPIANFLEKKRIPRIIAILISLILFLTIITLALLLLYKRVMIFAEDFPGFKAKALSNIDILESELERILGIREISLVGFLRERVTGLFDVGSDFVNKVFTATTSTIFRFVLIPVLIFMFLYFRTKFAYFFLKLVSREKQIVAVNVLREVSKVASRYMGGVLIVVLILCIINSSAFLLIGLKYAIVFGIISALWSFIPYFGTVIGYSFPFIFALLTGDTPNMALKVLVVYFIVHFTESNILSPNILGSSLNLNVLIIILGIIAGGMIWGVPGMFVVIPALAVVKVICEHVESLYPYVYLLGTSGTRKHAITAENIRKFLNRFRKSKNIQQV